MLAELCSRTGSCRPSPVESDQRRSRSRVSARVDASRSQVRPTTREPVVPVDDMSNPQGATSHDIPCCFPDWTCLNLSPRVRSRRFTSCVMWSAFQRSVDQPSGLIPRDRRIPRLQLVEQIGPLLHHFSPLGLDPTAPSLASRFGLGRKENQAPAYCASSSKTQPRSVRGWGMIKFLPTLDAARSRRRSAVRNERRRSVPLSLISKALRPAASTTSARSVLMHDASKLCIEIYRYLWRYLFSASPKNPVSIRIFDMPVIPVEAPKTRITASPPHQKPARSWA